MSIANEEEGNWTWVRAKFQVTKGAFFFVRTQREDETVFYLSVFYREGKRVKSCVKIHDERRRSSLAGVSRVIALAINEIPDCR